MRLLIVMTSDLFMLQIEDKTTRLCASLFNPHCSVVLNGHGQEETPISNSARVVKIICNSGVD